MKLIYHNYAELLDALPWLGGYVFARTGTGPEYIRIEHPEYVIKVAIPEHNHEASGRLWLLEGSLSPETMEALGIIEVTWVDDLKVSILCTSFEWVPAPLWALIVSPILSWAIEGDNKLFVWPYGRSKKPWRKSFWWVGKRDDTVDWEDWV